MAKAVTRYEARDGSIHETEAGALARDVVIDITEKLTEEFGHTIHNEDASNIAGFIATRYGLGAEIAFMYFESEEGGMGCFDFTREEGPKALRGWMDKDCKKGDTQLMNWAANARLGELFHHRMGVAVCVLKSAAEKS